MTTTTKIAHGKYHIWTVGCQMNQADSQRIQTILEELGWEETSMDQANLVVLNTCSVRKAPEEKAHNQLALLKRTVLPMAITPKPGERMAHYPTRIEPAKASPTAWLPIILGCNKVCTYCIVPYRRGRERSRPVEELVYEARSLVNKGAKELTLLGQTVEAYGLDLPDKPDLAHLMSQLSEINGLERIRFMTSYPRHMTDSMIERMANLPKVCEHLNIPVQAGDDELLRRMKRGYTLDRSEERRVGREGRSRW